MSYVAVVTQGTYPLVHEVSATTGDTRNSSTDANILSMSYTPPAGTYLVLFNADMISNAAGAAISCSYYVDAVQDAASLRKIIPFDGGTLSSTTARGIMQLQRVITVNGSNLVQVFWSISSGTATVAARSFVFQQVTAI